MNDTQIGFSMIVVAVALAGAVVGFHLATRSRNPFPR